MNVYFQLEYDGKIQAYLKMTGLQASDLNKSKSKKKADTSKQNTHSAPPQNQMGMHAGQMMQHLGYATTGNQATMMAPMGFPSSMASALPHFQQIWSAGQMYDQNQINQMQLMAAQAQQAQTTMMPGTAEWSSILSTDTGSTAATTATDTGSGAAATSTSRTGSTTTTGHNGCSDTTASLAYIQWQSTDAIRGFPTTKLNIPFECYSSAGDTTARCGCSSGA